MIPKDEELSLAEEVRTSILALISGVHDACGLSWDDRSPNWHSKKQIESLAGLVAQRLVGLGAIAIELHGDCGALGHAERASSVGSDPSSVGHWCIVVPALGDRAFAPVRDGTGIMTLDGQLYTTRLGDCTRNIEQPRVTCPCSPGCGKREHSLCRHFAWVPDPDSRLEQLAEIHLCLREAACVADDRSRRSRIREMLLVALVKLERLMVPQTAEAHAAERSALRARQCLVGRLASSADRTASAAPVFRPATKAASSRVFSIESGSFTP